MNYCWTHSGGGLGSGLSGEDKKAVKALFEKPGQIPKSLATYIDPEKTSNWLSKRQEKTTWEYECQKYEDGFEFVFQKKMRISEIVDKSSPVCKGWSYFTNLCSRVRNKISSKDAIVCGLGYLKTKAYTP